MADIVSFEELVEKVSNQAEIAIDHPFVFKKPIKKVAVIGAGFSGLCSIQSLKAAGFDVTAFEQTKTLGGLWNYTDAAPLKPPIQPQAEADQTINVPKKGKLETRPEVKNLEQALLQRQPPSACYKDLLTNISLKYMCFPDYMIHNDPNLFRRHEYVLDYANKYADHFDLRPYIQFNTRVERLCKKGDEWELVLCLYEVDSQGLKETRWREKFDAVVAASGQYHEPHVPDIPGLAEFDARWPEKISHSKQFRTPEAFKDKNVLIIGSHNSGIDAARSLNLIAKTITMTCRSAWIDPVIFYNHMRDTVPPSVVIKPKPVSFKSPEGVLNGTITFEDGTSISDIDNVIFCTGYRDSLGFLKVDKENIKGPESPPVPGRKCPLNTYLSLFLISDPTLALCGMDRVFSNNPTFYSQCTAIARVWSGQTRLPDKHQMQKFEAEFDLGLHPDIATHQRRLREIYVTLLNRQAESLGLDLPKATNYDKHFEKESADSISSWIQDTEENLKLAKEKIMRKPIETLR